MKEDAMERQPLPIRTILLLTVNLLMLLIVLLVAREVYLQWQRLRQIEPLQKSSFLREQMFDAIEGLSTERELGFYVLNAPNSDVAKRLQPRLEKNRKQVDQILKNINQALQEDDFSWFNDRWRSGDEVFAQLKIWRSKIDEALAHPSARHDRIVADRWFTQSTNLVGQMFDTWMEFTKHFTGIDPIVTQRMMYKHYLGIILRYSARERALIGGILIANAPVTPKDQVLLLQWQGVVEQGWKFSRYIADRAGLLPAITPYIHDAESHYFTLHDMVKDIFYVPGAQLGTSYPISADLWFELGNQTTDSLYALKNAANLETRVYIDQLEQKVRRAIWIHTFILAVALILCAYSFWMVSRRVLLPIQQMVEALVKATQGQSVSFAIPSANRRDEIGKLARVLHAFQESSERYRALVEASSQIVWTWQPGETGQMDALKAWWEEVTGQPGEELLPFGWLEPVHPNDREPARQIWSAASTSGNDFEMEYRLRTKRGDYRHIYVRGVALKHPDGSVREFVGTLSDVTSRKEAEQALRDSADRMRAVFDTVLDGIITIDSNAKVLSFNAAAERIFGYHAEEVIGQNVKMLMPEPYHAEHDSYVHNYLSTGKAKVIGIGREVAAQRKNGSVFPMELGISEFRIGATRAFAGIIRDISARKRAEEALKNYNMALERSNKELDDFAYIASHDLKEPLRGIHNHSRFLLEDNAAKLNEESSGRLHRLVYLSQRMERLVNDLLYFSRLGRQELAIQPTDLNGVIHDITDTLDHFLEERQARIVIPSPLPTVTCDQPRITEVFRNLITNASKYNDHPEKTIEIGYLKQHPSPQGTAANVFYVKDDGRGIAPEFHEEIFRIFKRLQGPDGTNEEGTGVGLTFVKKIIERHGGKIWLESEPGKGTTFYFTLEGKNHERLDTEKAA